MNRLKSTTLLLAYLAVCSPQMAMADTWSNTTVTAATGSNAPATGDCDTAVKKSLVEASQAQVTNQNALMGSLLNYLPADDSFLADSCLSNLLDGSLNVLFEPPNLQSLLDSAINQGCNSLETLKNQALQPITNLASQITSEESSGLDIGEVAPGFNMGGMNNVLSVSTNSGGTGSLVQTNITSMFQDTGTSSLSSNSFQSGLLGASN